MSLLLFLWSCINTPLIQILYPKMFLFVVWQLISPLLPTQTFLIIAMGQFFISFVILLYGENIMSNREYLNSNLETL